MNVVWQAFLKNHGARIESGQVEDFGDPAAEQRAARAGSVVADLSHLGVLEFSGEDAEAFLQGQLSCDVKALQPGGAAFGAYCSPKGRILASFLLVRAERAWLMLPSRTLTASLQKRLQMFVLRSKVVLRDRSEDVVRLGLSGTQALAALRQLRGESFRPGLQQEGSVAVEIPPERVVLLLSLEQAQRDWPRLRSVLQPVGTDRWEWLDIRSGIPLITETTRDQLVPQMANLELIGGVSFSKGCYPGQEIVARSQYLGKVKRRMYLASIREADAHPAAGDELFSDDLGGQASGLVVNAQASPEGGYDLLAVTQSRSKEASVVKLKSPTGPALRFGTLPYEVT